MEYVKNYLKNNIILLIIILILILGNVFSVGYFLYTSSENIETDECICEECKIDEVSDNIIEEKPKIKVDIKGYVNKPGVYELKSGSIINDLIKLAGGLKTTGTTDNINLSKELKNEDMIVVLSKSELKKLNSQINNPVSSNKPNNITTPSTDNNQGTINNKKISLNSASKEELMSLNGIGESKALNIIEYRNKTPFKDIKEIMNISGIGTSIYENIKDYITI